MRRRSDQSLFWALGFVAPVDGSQAFMVPANRRICRVTTMQAKLRKKLTILERGLHRIVLLHARRKLKLFSTAYGSGQ
jgi:hypothetical protein